MNIKRILMFPLYCLHDFRIGADSAAFPMPRPDVNANDLFFELELPAEFQPTSIPPPPTFFDLRIFKVPWLLQDSKTETSCRVFGAALRSWALSISYFDCHHSPVQRPWKLALLVILVLVVVVVVVLSNCCSSWSWYWCSSNCHCYLYVLRFLIWFLLVCFLQDNWTSNYLDGTCFFFSGVVFLLLLTKYVHGFYDLWMCFICISHLLLSWFFSADKVV